MTISEDRVATIERRVDMLAEVVTEMCGDDPRLTSRVLKGGAPGLEERRGSVHAMKTKLDSHTGMLQGVRERQVQALDLLKSHGEQLVELRAGQREHSKVLASHGEHLVELRAGQREHSKVLASHSKVLESHSKVLESHSRVLESHSKQLSDLKDGQRTIVNLLTTLIDRTKPAG